MYLDAIESVLAGSNLLLIDQKKSNNIMYLPLDRLLNRIEPKGSIANVDVSEDAILEARKKINQYRQRANRSGRTDRR